MSNCYICTVHKAVSENPAPVMCCSTCGIFTCVWDGARVHATGASECAICMVRVLVASANRLRPAGDPGGGGGIAAAAAEADVRAYLGTEDFERECEKLASISETYRDGWRGLLRLQLTTQMATEFGQRLAELAGGRTGLAESVAAGVANKTMDPELLADAAGVGEYARRLKTVGPRTLPSVAQAAADERAAEDARRELEARLDAEAAAARAATSSVIGGQPENTQETVVDEKVKFAGQ